MTDRFDDELGLPPELAALDAELSSIAYEERPSFAPELRAELNRVWQEEPPAERPRLPVRQLLAAGVAGLLMIGLGVPSARASLVRLLGSLPPFQEPVQTALPTRPAVPPTQGLLLDLDRPRFDDGGGLMGLPAQPAFVAPEAPPRRRSAYAGPEAVLPRLRDRSDLQGVVAEYYPPELEAAGIGGTVRLLLWVDSAGRVDFVNLGRSSGEEALDAAALDAAPSFLFEPAERLGERVGTWVEFDLVFEAPAVADSLSRETEPPGEPEPVTPPLAREGGGTPPPVVSAWRGGVVLSSPVEQEAEELLRRALDQEGRAAASLGPLSAILQGNPPAGAAPTAWRRTVSAALEEAMVRDPDNPAPLLALARIRRRQGLRGEAQTLVERGLARTSAREGAISGSLRAELHSERASLLGERWRALRGVGWIPAEALDGRCPRARSGAVLGAERAAVEHLVALNFLCPEELTDLLDTRLRADEAAEAELRASMLDSYREAVRAFPAHVGASVGLLGALAEEGDWVAVAEAARPFVWASRGHPDALFLSGIALHRLGRSDEAEARFEEALAALPASEAEAMEDVGVLLAGDEGEAYRALPAAERLAWVQGFWSDLDPIRATRVNERRMEHLARAAWARLHTGDLRGDAAEVILRYGEPDRVRVVEEGGGLGVEFWDYGTGPDVPFRRTDRSGSVGLTPEGRAYLDELQGVFPHRAGPLGREVLALAGEVLRFRSERRGTVELLADVEVPEVFRGSPGDSLDVHLFVTDGEGGSLTGLHARLAADESALRLALRAPVSARDVRVELLDGHGRRVAALDHELPAEVAEGSPDASDLLLTRRASPDAEAVSRDASWIVPLTPGAVDDPVVGVLWELYDLERGTSWYRIRAELQPVAGGAPLELAVRPAGEDGYGAGWDRLADPDGTTEEFLELAVGNVSRGRYRLRVLAELPLGGETLVAERALSLR